MTSKAIERRYRLIGEMGCVACRKRGRMMPPDIHHLNLDGKAGQKRRGNDFTIGLCPWHHRGVMPPNTSQADATALYGPSLAHSSRRFRAEFGSDEELLARVDAYIKSRTPRRGK